LARRPTTRRRSRPKSDGSHGKQKRRRAETPKSANSRWYARGRDKPATVRVKPTQCAADNQSMQITSMNPVALSPANAQQQVSNQAQVSLARKVMDVQKQQAATLLKQLDGMGQNLDVRV